MNLRRYIVTRKWTFIVLIVLIPIGILSKSYSGPAYVWVHNSFGGILYVLFWTLCLSIVLPRIKSWIIASIVFLITCLVELLQLWHPHFLTVLRATLIGRILLGNSFSWLDIFHYAVGLMLAVALLNHIRIGEQCKNKTT